jgi:hypothetical protein
MISSATSSVALRATAFRGTARGLAPARAAPLGARRGASVVRASGIDPESLAILQQKLGQRIELEGQGAESLNQTAGLLLGADGRAIDKDERKKVLKADEAGKQALEISYDPEGLFPEVDETSASMLIDKKLRARELELERRRMRSARRNTKRRARSSKPRATRACSPPRTPSSWRTSSTPSSTRWSTRLSSSGRNSPTRFSRTSSR